MHHKARKLSQNFKNDPPFFYNFNEGKLRRKKIESIWTNTFSKIFKEKLIFKQEKLKKIFSV